MYFHTNVHPDFIALNDLQFVIPPRCWTRGGLKEGLIWCSTRHCMTVPRVYANGLHICKRGQYLFHFVKGVLVRVGLHLLPDDSCANVNEIMVLIFGGGSGCAYGAAEYRLHRLQYCTA